MTPRDLAFRLVTLLAFAVIVAAALVLTVLHALAIELTDDVAASRNEHRTINRLRGNTVQPKNVKLTDIASQHRAINAKLAAIVGVNTMQARAELSDARQLAAELAMVRRSA